ncbi:MAG TPA: fibronectin type III domain-containing protein [Thermoanaerobaculia bacterium]|nr:fibronectin type III domain-containing protein [Thermoanaerobaculia bacterium]
MSHPSLRTSLAISLLSLSTLAPVGATTYVMMPDEALVDSSPLIVEGRVVSISGAPVEVGSTDYRVEILRLLKGSHPGAEIVVRQLGGVNPEGQATKIWGLTRLGLGDRALLFLVPRRDGTYGVNQLILGAFREVESAGQRVAVRDLEAATELRMDASGQLASLPGGDRPRDVEGFSQWIVQRVQGQSRAKGYFRDGVILPKFNLFADTACGGGDGMNIRWFIFDSAGTVSFTARASGQPGLADGGFGEVQTALAAWTNDASSPINYGYAGTTSSTGTNNNIVFDDPNAMIAGSFNCAGGGVVAVGGPSYSCSLQLHNGQNFHPTANAFVVTQDGIGCLFAGAAGITLAQEMFAHELGHTLGLAHSLVPGALMNPNLHSPSIGATLSGDEIAAVSFLYGSGVVPPPPPAAPTNLMAVAMSSSQIQLHWIDNATNEDTFRIEMNSGFGFSEILDVGANTTMATINGLSASTNYSFRVRAHNSGGDSTFSNVAAATTMGGGVGGSAPMTPTSLQAAAASSTSIQLTWNDNAVDETSFVVEMRPTASGAYIPIATLTANTASYTATGLTALTSYTFRVKAHNGFGDSGSSNEAAATTLAGAAVCAADPTALCLATDRFSVKATFDTTGGLHGTAQPVKLTADTGYFWFFASTNVEVVIKVLDACTFTPQPAFWVFASGLTDVHVVITVTDLTSGQSHVYVNPIQTAFQPIQDTFTFQTCNAVAH